MSARRRWHPSRRAERAQPGGDQRVEPARSCWTWAETTGRASKVVLGTSRANQANQRAESRAEPTARSTRGCCFEGVNVAPLWGQHVSRAARARAAPACVFTASDGHAVGTCHIRAAATVEAAMRSRGGGRVAKDAEHFRPQPTRAATARLRRADRPRAALWDELEEGADLRVCMGRARPWAEAVVRSAHGERRAGAECSRCVHQCAPASKHYERG
eukprot:4171219-Prymnesium_polylepis.1